jgi:small GTP-binding protein
MSLHGIAEGSAKVVLLGDSGVGKSSVALRFTRNEFRPYCESTIGASFMTKAVLVPPPSIVEGGDSSKNDEGIGANVDTETEAQSNSIKPRKVQFNIWDTAGQEKYASLAPMYYRGAAASILVYDITNRASFQVLKAWAEELRNRGPSDIVIAVCGNKLDLEEARQVTLQEAKDFAEEIGAFCIETSARDDANVESMFVELAKRLPKSTMHTQHDDDVGVSLRLGGSSKRICC